MSISYMDTKVICQQGVKVTEKLQMSTQPLGDYKLAAVFITGIPINVCQRDKTSQKGRGFEGSAGADSKRIRAATKAGQGASVMGSNFISLSLTLGKCHDIS